MSKNLYQFLVRSFLLDTSLYELHNKPQVCRTPNDSDRMRQKLVSRLSRSEDRFTVRKTETVCVCAYNSFQLVSIRGSKNQNEPNFSPKLTKSPF